MNDIFVQNLIHNEHEREAKRYSERIAALEAENAALWRFVRADDAMQAHDRECDGEDADACQVFGAELVYAREALREYEGGTE